MLGQCWASVEDDGPTLIHYRANVSCLLVTNMLMLTPADHYLYIIFAIDIIQFTIIMLYLAINKVLYKLLDNYHFHAH